MRFILPVFLLILTSSFTSAQDWQMFPLDQKSYYQHSYLDDQVVEVLWMDSVLPSSNGFIHYFEKNIPFRKRGKCFDSVYEVFSERLNDPTLVDSLIISGDTVFHFYDKNNPFLFLPRSNENQSWVLEYEDHPNLRIICSKATVDTIFGRIDSIKIFSFKAVNPSNQDFQIEQEQIILSKNFGLVEFLPFFYFKEFPKQKKFNPFKLIGLQNSQNNAGYNPPKFKEFFDFEAGDLINRYWSLRNKWDVTVDNGDYRDSIKKVIDSAHRVDYLMERREFADDGTLEKIKNTRAIYLKEDYNNLIKALPNSVAIGGGYYGEPGNILWVKSAMKIHFDSKLNDTVTSFNMTYEGYFLDTLTCKLNQHNDSYSILEMESLHGILGFCKYEMGSYCIGICGLKTQGHIWGNISSINTIHPQHREITIYPNPTSSTLLIKSAYEISFNFRIINQLGMVVKTGKLSGQSIDVHELKTGSYILQLFDDQRLSTYQFIKE